MQPPPRTRLHGIAARGGCSLRGLPFLGCLALIVGVLMPAPLPAATLHVWQESPNPTAPFATWETAARVLQDAMDAAETGDTVLVTNGVYATGGRLLQGEVSNRVAIPAGVVVQSAAGPEVTIIEGAASPVESGGNRNGNGNGAVRCAHLGRGAILVGFTLRNGHTRTNGLYDWDQSGGGAWSEAKGQLVKCILTQNAAHHMGGGAFGVELVQCQVLRNTARYGGGVCLGTVTDSTVTRNSAENGGGAYLTRLTRCTVSGNSANIGGGSMGGSMFECVISGNSAGQWGGGVSQTTLQKCEVTANTAERGGGAFLATLFACVLSGNVADLGGGAAGGTLRHCTVTGNTAGSGGGTYLGSIHHSIVYFNDAIFGPNHEGSTLLDSCTTPLPESGAGNLSDDPLLASHSHLSADSPCQAMDATAPEIATDLDGEPWQQPSSMGADQFVPGGATGVLAVAIAGGVTQVAVHHTPLWRADIKGRTTGSEWDFGDGRVVRNQPYVRHGWDQPGTYEVTLTAFNDTFPEGIRATLTVQVVEQPVHYVSLSSFRPTPPFASWDTAAPTIQAAIDAATVPGSLILVTNGVYNRGGASLPGDVLVNRVALTKPVLVQSVHGPSETFIVGAGPLSDVAVRGAFVGRDAVLSGFTLTNGHTRTLGARPREQRGGGVSGEALGVVTNCVLTGNLARQFGAGANRTTLRNSVLVRNHSLDGGGGAYECRLEDCTLDANQASNTGGGASRASLLRCSLVGNSAPLGAGAYFGDLTECRLEGNASQGDGYGGGANGSILRDCVLTRNLAYSGGGAYAASLFGCRLEGNEARRDGGGATESSLTDCVLVGNTAPHGGGTSVSLLTRCDLSGNHASVAGGAADGGELEQCALSGNSAFYGGATEHATLRRCVLRENSAVFGGAGYRDLHYNSLFVGNVATNQGGAAFQSQLFHCTVTGNSAQTGGGTYDGTNRNCIVYFNTALAGPDFVGSILTTSCTGPSPALLPGNLTNPPSFFQPDTGNYRLRSDSPCIDAGADLTHLVGDDLEGLQRPIDGNLDALSASDIGAYEYDPETSDTNADGIHDAWYLRYGLDASDPQVGALDPDQDSHTSREEWIADTNPVDPDSALSVFTFSKAPPITVYVSGSVGREYTLQARSDWDPVNPEFPQPTWTPVPGQERIPGLGGRLALQDTNAVHAQYYRVQVDLAPAPPPAVLASRIQRAPALPQPARVRPGLTEETSSGDRAWLPDGDGLVGAWAASLGAVAVPQVLESSTPATTALASVASNGESRIGAGRPALHAVKPPITEHRFRIAAGSEIPISPLLRGQEPFMLYATSARGPTLEWGRGATYRGVAGGTDAETYHWKELTASSRPHEWSYHVDDPPVVTTLEWLEQARDYDAELVLTVNSRGRGRTTLDADGHRLWVVDPATNDPDYVAQLAADWVRYANLIAPRYRLTPDRQLPAELAATDPDADRILRELASLGNGTNAWRYRLATVADPTLEVDPPVDRPLLLEAEAPLNTRKVTYWEIGNEVETPMSVLDPRGLRPMEPGINLTPAQYVERYLRITDAMRRVDPTILVGPCPNNPWGPRAGIENQHLIQLLARPEATIDVLYYHYYNVWAGDYFRPAEVNRNLRSLKNFAHLLHTQYSAQFARAGRTPVPAIISEWNPDWTIHPPIERNLVSALATADVFLTFAELRVLGAHYWENPAGRASAFVFDRLQTHFGDVFLGSSHGRATDDGTYVSFGTHPSSSSDVRIYATQRSSDARVFLWMINFSDTVTHTVAWDHPYPIVQAQTHTLKDPARATTYYTPVSQLAWVSEAPRADQESSLLPPASLAILELTYATPAPSSEPPPPRSPTRQTIAPREPPSPQERPEIASVSPTLGAKDTEVLIAGQGFAPSPSENIVHFGFGRATVLSATPSLLRVAVPATATYGPVTVTTRGRTAYSVEVFNLAANPGHDEPLGPESLNPVSRRIYPPEGAPMVTAPVDLLLADWNGDGRLHLAGLTTRAGSVLPHTIDLFPNVSSPGQPDFATPICSPQMPGCSLPLNASPAKIAMGDLDGDGLLDLACVDRHAWHVAAWRNAHPSPDRSFDVLGLFPTGRSPSSVAIHDLDGDGRPDFIVTLAADHALGVLRNLSPGPGQMFFSTNWLFRPSDPNQMVGPHAIAIGNVVGDARPDVVIASRSSPGLTVFRNDSTPGRPSLIPLAVPSTNRIESMTLGDVDGDGRLDVVACGQWPNGGITVWRNTGDDTFERLTFPTSRDPREMSVVDVNGDGRPDVLTVNNDTSSVSVLRNQSTPGAVAFDVRQDFPIPGLLPNDPICLVTGDIDGDGRADVAVGHYYSGLITLLLNQTGR